MKRSIADYLRQGFEGPYFFRMVETVLSRDKNWVRWKIENCPPMGLPPVTAELFAEAKKTVQRNTTNKRLRPTPMGSLNLDFLMRSNEGEGEEDAGLERLKHRDRYALPELDSFKRKIADDDFEIEMPTNAQTKAAAVEGKASKSWRALRIAGRIKLAAFDRIDDPDKIDVVFEDDAAQGGGGDDDDEAEEDAARVSPEDMPEDKTLVVVAGLAGSGKSALVEGLLAKRPGVFKRVVRHAARVAGEGEVDGREYKFVSAETFNVMLNNDQFIEFGQDGDGVEYGTSRRIVEGILEKGRVPIVEVPVDVSNFPFLFILPFFTNSRAQIPPLPSLLFFLQSQKLTSTSPQPKSKKTPSHTAPSSSPQRQTPSPNASAPQTKARRTRRRRSPRSWRKPRLLLLSRRRVSIWLLVVRRGRMGWLSGLGGLCMARRSEA